MSRAFASELARFGPDGGYRPLSAAEAHVYCADFTRRNAENFTVASLLLPRRLLRHFHAVYAYCRWADDLADETDNGPRALELLAWWRRELLACYEGSPRHPVFLALRETIRRFKIPPAPFLDLLSAFEQDQRVKEYQTYEQLLDYCTRSANPVGRLVLYLGEAFDERRAQLSDAVCTALQLTNFWQDVSRDLDKGRVYLPEADRREFGYSEQELRQRLFTPAFAELLKFEVGRARALFERGRPLIGEVPASLQTEVELFIAGGLGTLRKIEEAGYNVWVARPALSRLEKGLLLVRALGKRVLSSVRGGKGGPPCQA